MKQVRAPLPTAVFMTLLFAVLLASCGQQPGTQPPPAPSPDPAPTGVITGTLQQPDGTPLANQQLTLARDDAAPSALQTAAADIITTNESGAFATDVDEAGQYVLTYRDVRLGIGAGTTITVQERDGTLSSDPVTMDATPLGAVTGTVSNQGAGVLVYLAGTSYLALTDADGDFAISNVPADTYGIQAAVAGSTGPSRTVTVTSGATAALSQALQLGPTISSVTPDGLLRVTEAQAYGDEALPDLTIEGTGFGPTQGTSRVLHAGLEVPPYAITKWSDTRISIDGDGFVGTRPDYYAENVDIDRLRFDVVTPGGSATSGISGLALSQLYAEQDFGDPSRFVAVYSVYEPAGASIDGITLSLRTTNGAALDPDTLAPVDTYTTDYPRGEGSFLPSLTIQPDGRNLPVVLTLEAASGSNLVIPFSDSIAISAGSFEGDVFEIPYAPTTITGTLFSDSAQTIAMPDDGEFAVAFSAYDPTTNARVDLGTAPLTIDETGAARANFSAPDVGFVPAYVALQVHYRGTPLGSEDYIFIVTN